MTDHESAAKLLQTAEALLVRQNQILARLNTLSIPTAPSETEANRIDTFRERLYYRDFPLGEAEMPDFRARFLRLVDGLDEASVQTVVLALNRLRKIRSTEERYLPLYSDAELKEYRENRERLSQELIRLSEDCWYYRGRMLPEAYFEASVFADGCGLRYLEHPERFAERDIIDAGAYIGDSALVFSPLTTARVWAFEPTAENYAKLLKTIELNQLTNVVPCRLALGKEKGSAEMAKSMIASVHTQIPNSAVPYTGSETVEVTTLDSFVEENGLNVGLIKVDVEGAEQLLLQGALETIRRMKPALLFSIYHNADDFFCIKPILEELGLGYRFRIRHPAIGTVLTETMLIAETQ